jgi:hypothetical protein
LERRTDCANAAIQPAQPAIVPIQTAPSRVSRMVRMLLSARLSVEL